MPKPKASKRKLRKRAIEEARSNAQAAFKDGLHKWYCWMKQMDDDETAVDAGFDVMFDALADYIEASHAK